MAENGSGGREHKVNMVNNYYKPGPARPGNKSSNFVRASYHGEQQTWQIPLWYMNGNYMEGSANINRNTNNYNGLNADEYTAKGVAKSSIISASAFEVPYAVTTETAQEAFQSVLTGAGAFPRDTVDSRIVDEARKGIAYYGGQTIGLGKGIIDRPSDVGGYPEYQTYDTIIDMDKDGMDDLWELEHKLDPLNPEDRNLKLSSGYTVLEAYLNSLVGEDIPFDNNELRYYDFIVAKDGSGDFETLSAAIEAVRGAGRKLIYVKKGVYEEKVYLVRTPSP
jgi:pectate lyase